MLGWMILFAVMMLVAMMLMVLGHPAGAAVRIASTVFALLFVVGLLTRAARERAW